MLDCTARASSPRAASSSASQVRAKKPRSSSRRSTSIVNARARRCEDAEHGATDVADVDDRPPGAAIREKPDPARRERPADEVVQDDVEAKPRRDAVRGGVPQGNRREPGVGEPGEPLL